jgi:hypothetical protein
MGRRKKYTAPIPDKFHREPRYVMETGRVIENGEIVKIHGEHGSRFRFLEHVVNKENGIEWIDCFEMRQGIVSGWRSFRCERIKPLPKKRRERKL